MTNELNGFAKKANLNIKTYKYHQEFLPKKKKGEKKEKSNKIYSDVSAKRVGAAREQAVG